MSYPILISAHSGLRWLVLLAAAWALFRAYSGWAGKKLWAPADRRAGLIFTTLFDVQVLVGLALYFFASPITRAFLADTSVGFANPGMRFFGAEHIALMVVAVVVAHLGSILSRRGEDVRRHRTAALLYTLALALVLVAIPWPFSPVARPWF